MKLKIPGNIKSVFHNFVMAADLLSPNRCQFGIRISKMLFPEFSVSPRVRIVRPSEAKAREPYDIYLRLMFMEFQNPFCKYLIWGFS